MKLFYLFRILIASGFLFSSAHIFADPAASIRQNEYSLSRGHLALQGYDPVSYFKSSGPLKGRKSITTEYNGIHYRFGSETNKREFLKNPTQYEPEYGGWCAWAMLEGDRTESNPESYKIVEGKVYLFYDGFFGDTLKKWNEKAEETPETQLIETADEHWSDQIR
mgnify:CR=1 FL=1